MYGIEILDPFGVHITYLRNYLSLKIKRVMKGASSINLEIPSTDFLSGKNVLRKKNKIFIRENNEVIRRGVLSDAEPKMEKILITGYDYFDNLRGRRLVNVSYGNQSLEYIAIDLINRANSIYDTGIENIDVESSKQASISVSDMPISSVFSKLGDAGLEFYVYSNTFYGREVVGSEKAGFIYDDIRPQLNNITRPSVTEKGKRLFNKIYAKNNNGDTVTLEDQESIDKYGLYEESVVFDEAGSLETLQKMTQEYLDLHKDEQIVVKFEPLIQRDDQRKDYHIGDLCKVQIRKGYNSVNRYLRITGLEYNIAEKSSVDYGISMELSDKNVPERNILEEFVDMKKKIKEMELKI